MSNELFGERPAVEKIKSTAGDLERGPEPLENPHAPTTADELVDLESPASLLRQLAKLEGIFAAIRTAADFTLVDERTERDWIRLSRLADQIARDLKAFGAQVD